MGLLVDPSDESSKIANVSSISADYCPKPVERIKDRFDIETAQRFIPYVLEDPTIGCVELRILNAKMNGTTVTRCHEYPKTYGGWYNDPLRLLNDLKFIQGVSAYLTSTVTVCPRRRGTT